MNKELFEKYLNDQCTPEEAERVYEWLHTSEGEAYLKVNIDRDIRVDEEFQDYIEYPDLPSEEIFARIQHDKSNHSRTLPRKDNYRVWRWIGIAAASIMLLISAVYYLQYEQKQNRSEAQQSPYPVTIVTAEDQDSTVNFTDGTRITLASSTQLEISEGYSREHRNVQLQGKAFFEVSEDTTLPFIVQTNYSYIRVLGTKFEVEAYSDKGEVKVKVEEGKVRFFSKDNRVDPINLRSNESGVLHLYARDPIDKESDSVAVTREKPILIRHQSVAEDSKIKFSNNRLFIAINYLERKYDVNIELKNESLRHRRFTLVTDRSLLGAIKRIADSLDLVYEYHKQDDKLLLKKKEGH